MSLVTFLDLFGLLAELSLERVNAHIQLSQVRQIAYLLLDLFQRFLTCLGRFKNVQDLATVEELLTGRLDVLHRVRLVQETVRHGQLSLLLYFDTAVSVGRGVDDLLRDGKHEARLANGSLLDLLVFQLGEHLERLSLLAVTEAELAASVHADDAWLVAVAIHEQCHGGADCDLSHLERVDSLRHLDAQTLLHMLVMQDTPEIHAIILVHGRIEVPAGNSLERNLFVREQLLVALACLEGLQTLEREQFEASLLGVDAELVLVVGAG